MMAHGRIQKLSDATLSRLSNLLAEKLGLDFPEKRWHDLERGLLAAARELESPDLESCAHRVLGGPLSHYEIEILASHLTVGETYFFRDRESFDVLEQQLLPPLIDSRRHSGRFLRIWSAGCCTGEEPYSIAMLLDRLLPAEEEWHVTLLATDINPIFLRKARAGIYGEWSFRGVPSWIRDRYFTRKDSSRFEMHPRIRKMVAFSHLNLADDIYPSLANNTNAMDLIFCRNVLMYFTEARMHKVIGHLRRALVNGGCLNVSPSEASGRLFEEFMPANFGTAMYYRKVAGTSIQSVVPAYQYQAYPDAISAVPELTPDIPDPAPAVQIQSTSPLVDAHETTAASPERIEVSEAGMDAAKLFAEAKDCANQGRLKEAADLCEQAIDTDKLDPRSHYLLASIWQELGRTAAAEASLKRVLYLDPEFVLASFSFGNLRMSQGRYRDAERYFRNALSTLRQYEPIEAVPGTDGLQAGRLSEIVTSVLDSLPRTGAMESRMTNRREVIGSRHA